MTMAIRTAPMQRWDTQRLLDVVPPVFITAWALLLVLAHSTGRVTTPRALVLLAFPVVALGVFLRPAWVVLFLVTAPLAQLQAVPMRGLVILVAATLVGQLIMQGRISIGWRSGFVGLAILVLSCLTFRVDLSPGDAEIARGMVNDFTYYLLLGLLTYNTTRSGDLRAPHFINAVLIGVTVSVALDMTYQYGAIGSGVVSVGRPIAYLAAAGFAICFARLITRTPDGSIYHPVLHAVLGCGFFFVMIPGLLRGAWLSALLAVLLVSSWSRRKRYWLLISLALVAIVSVPVARERVIPTDERVSGGGFTTGRLELWTRLWEEIEPGLPWGNGFGHTVTLDSQELFGTGSTDFTTEAGNTFVYPHNDFLFWMVELGVIGALGMLLFWTQLIRAFGQALRSTWGPYIIVVAGVLAAGFVSQIVGSTFFFRALATPFFAVAGFVFGVRASATSAWQHPAMSEPLKEEA